MAPPASSPIRITSNVTTASYDNGGRRWRPARAATLSRRSNGNSTRRDSWMRCKRGWMLRFPCLLRQHRSNCLHRRRDPLPTWSGRTSKPNRRKRRKLRRKRNRYDFDLYLPLGTRKIFWQSIEYCKSFQNKVCVELSVKAGENTQTISGDFLSLFDWLIDWLIIILLADESNILNRSRSSSPGFHPRFGSFPTGIPHRIAATGGRVA